MAQEIARHLTEQTGGTYRLVQFHPSYAYGDFFEGFRPQAGMAAGTVAFGLEPGPFRLLASEAAANPAAVHVLVIDEINRPTWPRCSASSTSSWSTATAP